MIIIWVRGHEKITTKRPHTDFICSPVRGGGKSSLLEHRAETYLQNGNTVVDFFGCYCDETELETIEGWKTFKEITKTDHIKTLNFDKVEYHQPYEIQEYDYEGEMIHIGSLEGEFDLLVTPDHRLYLESETGHRCIRRAYEIQAEAQTAHNYTGWRLLRDSENGLIRIPLRKKDIITEHYSGKIYDVTVPNHTLYVRRKSLPDIRPVCHRGRKGNGQSLHERQRTINLKG